MTRGRALLAICGSLLALSLVGNGTAELSGVLDAIQKHYDAIKDIQADFVQTSHVASIGRDEVMSGRVQVLRPGRMRWEYREPERRIIVMDLESLRIYSPEERTLQIVKVESGSLSPAALSFLLGEGDLRASFRAERSTESRADQLGLKLRPREDAAFEFLEIWLDKESYELRETLVVDLFGNRTRVVFTALSENSGVKEKVFSIRVPEDTEVLDLR